MRRSVTIIILTWNGFQYTRQCLASLKAAIPLGQDCRVLVVDNGSTDGTIDFLKNQDWVTLIENDRNLGFVRGNNTGIRAAPTGSDIVLLNNDMVITQQDWLERMQSVAYSAPDVGLVGCRLLMPNGRLLHAGTFMPIDTFWGQQIGSNEKDINQFNADREVEGVVAACLYIKREVIERIGPLNEAYFSYFEDTDYCLTARQAGYRTMCAGGVTLIHHENVSSRVNRVNFSAQFVKSQRTFKRRWAKHLHPHYQHRLAWHSGQGCFSYISKELAVQLDALGVEVRMVGIDATDWTGGALGHYLLRQMVRRHSHKSLIHVTFGPDETLAGNAGHHRIGYTAFEPDSNPAALLQRAHGTDELWVTSVAARQALIDEGFSKPIHVMPWGVNPDYLNSHIKAFRPSARWTFLARLSWTEREALERLLQAYTAEFSPDEAVLLMVKLTGGGKQARRQWAQPNLPDDCAPAVLLPDPALPVYQRGSLYRSADCFVMPVSSVAGELWALEAMACGLSLVACARGGITDVLSHENGYPVPPAADPAGVQKALRHAMRQTFEEQAMAREKGARAADQILAEYTWRRAAERIVQRLKEIAR
jgi:GT2 family glycosyltransferase